MGSPLKTDILKISKLDAARRQLDCAIRLWFADKDQVSVHTLAAAAYQIIDDLNREKGTAHELVYHSNLIRPEFRSKWISLIKKPGNFFKHADNDPAEILEFSPVSSLLFMLISIKGIELLGEQGGDATTALFLWVAFNESELVTEDVLLKIKASTSTQGLALLKRLPKNEFFESFLTARAQLKMQGL